MAYRVDRSITVRSNTGEELVALLDDEGNIAGYARPDLAAVWASMEAQSKRLSDLDSLLKFLDIQVSQMLHAIKRHIRKG